MTLQSLKQAGYRFQAKYESRTMAKAFATHWTQRGWLVKVYYNTKKDRYELWVKEEK